MASKSARYAVGHFRMPGLESRASSANAVHHLPLMTSSRRAIGLAPIVVLLMALCLVSSSAQSVFYIQYPASSATVFDGTCSQTCTSAAPCTLTAKSIVSSGITALSAATCPSSTVLTFVAGSVMSGITLQVPSSTAGYTFNATGVISVGAADFTIVNATLSLINFTITGAGNLIFNNATVTSGSVSNTPSSTGGFSITGTAGAMTSVYWSGNSSSHMLPLSFPAAQLTYYPTGALLFATVTGSNNIWYTGLNTYDSTFSGFNQIWWYGTNSARNTLTGGSTSSQFVTESYVYMINCTLINWGSATFNAYTNIQIGTTPFFQGYLGAFVTSAASFYASYNVTGLPKSSWPQLFAPSAYFINPTSSAIATYDYSGFWNLNDAYIPSTYQAAFYSTSLQGPFVVNSTTTGTLSTVWLDCSQAGSSPCLIFPKNAHMTNWDSVMISSPSTCEVQFYEDQNITSAFIIDTVCAATGSAPHVNLINANTLTITSGIAPGGAISFLSQATTKQGTAQIGSIAITSTSPVTFSNFSTFTYSLTNPTVGITSASSALTINAGPVLNVLWPSTTSEPVVGQSYPFITSTGGNPSLSFTSAAAAGRNVTLSGSGSSYSLVFNQVPCNASCVPAHMSTTTCASTQACSCVPPWGGPLCDCDTSLIPPYSGIYCSPNGGPVWLSYNNSVSNVNVPPGYTLILNAPDSFISMSAYNIILNNSILAVQNPPPGYPAPTVNLGALSIYTTLAQTTVSINNQSTCVTYPTAGIRCPNCQIGLPATTGIVIDATSVAGSTGCNTAMPPTFSSAAIISGNPIYGTTYGSNVASYYNTMYVDIVCTASSAACSSLNMTTYLLGNQSGSSNPTYYFGTPAGSGLCTTQGLASVTTYSSYLSAQPCAPSAPPAKGGEYPIVGIPLPTPTSQAPVAAPTTSPSASPVAAPKAPTSPPGTVTPPSAPVSSPAPQTQPQSSSPPPSAPSSSPVSPVASPVADPVAPTAPTAAPISGTPNAPTFTPSSAVSVTASLSLVLLATLFWLANV